MRTTLTLDDDVAARLRSEACKSGEPFKQVVNDCLRIGLNTRVNTLPVPPLKVKARPLGLRSAYSYDNVWELLERIEGAHHR